MESFRGNARYQIVRELGVGGMGVVYEAIDGERGDRRVALKVLQGQDADSLVRLKREFRTLHDVRHPNLVSLYELMADGDTWFFTLELIDGVDFLSWVRPTTAQLGGAATTADLAKTVRSAVPPSVRLDLEKVKSSFRQLAEGVSFLHSRDRVQAGPRRHSRLRPRRRAGGPEEPHGRAGEGDRRHRRVHGARAGGVGAHRAEV